MPSSQGLAAGATPRSQIVPHLCKKYTAWPHPAPRVSLVGANPVPTLIWPDRRRVVVTRNTIDTGLYRSIRQSLVAKQPYKDGAKNAALYTKQK